MTAEITALIGSIQKFSTEDGPGVRTTVFLKGCPLECAWCHNPEMIDPAQHMIVSPQKCIGCGECVKACPNNGIVIGENGPEIKWDACVSCGECASACYAFAIKPIAQEMTVSQVFEKVLQDRDFYMNTGGGLTISGGEVMMHYDFAKALIEMCAGHDIKVCIDTSGYGDYDQLADLAKHQNVEYLLYDMKHIDNDVHKKYTGVDNTIIIDNMKRLVTEEKLADKLWMRMPLISGVNDDEETIEKTKQLYKELGISKVSLMAYHDYGNSKGEHMGVEMVEFEAPSEERMNTIKETFESIGMNVEISGKEETIA